MTAPMEKTLPEPRRLDAPTDAELDARDRFIAFAGRADDRLEMLFVDPAHRGRGAGRCLVDHLVARGVRRTEVNEQNTAAALFYARMGFRTVARDPLDATGRPYPILRLELK